MSGSRRGPTGKASRDDELEQSRERFPKTLFALSRTGSQRRVVPETCKNKLPARLIPAMSGAGQGGARDGGGGARVGGSDVARPTVDSIPTPPSPPSEPMTRARVKALHDKVNSLLSTFDLGSTLDGLLLHSDPTFFIFCRWLYALFLKHLPFLEPTREARVVLLSYISLLPLSAHFVLFNPRCYQ